MKTPEYHIQSVNADLNPEPGECRFAATHVELEIGDGNYDEGDDILTTEATFELELYSVEDHEDIEDEEDMGDPSYGSIEFEVVVFVDDFSDAIDDDIDVEEQLDIWDDGRYSEMEPDVIVTIESGFVQDIIGPTAQLLSESFYGILPIYRFTESPEEAEENQDEE